MGNFIKITNIIMGDGLPDIERIDAKLKSLITTVEGTIPGSRDFGLPQNFLSMRPIEASNTLAVELEEKVSVYIPEITISDVIATPQRDGTIGVELVVERRE